MKRDAWRDSLGEQLVQMQLNHQRSVAEIELAIKHEELAKAKVEREVQEIIREKVRAICDIEQLPWIGLKS